VIKVTQDRLVLILILLVQQDPQEKRDRKGQKAIQDQAVTKGKLVLAGIKVKQAQLDPAEMRGTKEKQGIQDLREMTGLLGLRELLDLLVLTLL
jgi:hypothetical protein